MRFVICHMLVGAKEPPTYYRLDGLGRLSRDGDLRNATDWPTEAEAREAIRQFGLSGDPSVSVMPKGG
jgi:hypothetical protein